MNVLSSTTRTTLFITYGSVINNGGSPITNYFIYIDDGLDGAFTGPIDNGMSLTWDSSALTLTTGRLYRL